MRMIVQSKPCFLLNISSGQQVVKEYKLKYNRIDEQLEKTPEILKIFHKDLKNFASSNGRESDYSSEQILRVLIIKTMECMSFRDLVIRLEHDDFLRNFARIGMGTVMTFTFINSAFKMVSAETWKTINTLLAKQAQGSKKISGDKLRVDSTVMETNIHYPTDAFLLWDVFRVLSREIRQVVDLDRHLNMGFRFHDRKAKKLFVYVSTHCGKKNRSTVRKVAKEMKLLVERTEDLVEKAKLFIANAAITPSGNFQAMALCNTIEKQIPLAHKITQQARRSQINGETVPAVERIFSFFEEHTELLKRGKVQKPIEFGHLVTLAQNGQKFITDYIVEEKSRHDTEYKDEILKNHKRLFGKHPEVFTADKNYYKGADDIEKWEKKIPVYGIAKKGNRDAAEYAREHSEEFKSAQRFRAGCEGTISVLKRAFGLRKCINRSFKSFASTIGCLVFCHNLVVLGQT